MSDSFLSFGSSAQFRNTLIARNLAPYSVPGVFAPQSSNVNYETNLTVTNVIDSPNNLVSTNNQANILYPLNEYGPEGGFGTPIGLSNTPLAVDSNKGPYDPNDTVIDLVNEFFIDAAYIQNTYGPQGGFNNFVIITDIVKPGKIYQPYWEPPTFAPSSYSPYDILLSNNPNGSNGSLSQDSYIVQLGSNILKGLLLENQNFYSQQSSQSQDSINFSITVDDVNDNYLSRLAGSYVPFSPIPGDYFLDGITNRTTDTLGEAINLVAGRSTLLGGALNGSLTRAVNQSQLFLENTNDGQKGIMFANISKNIYRPAYGGSLLAGIGTNLVTTGINSLIDGFGLQLPGAYYIGSTLSEPSYLESPINATPTDVYGRDTQAIVFGGDVLGKEYEKNEEKINFGLKAKSYTNSGSIDGEFVWTSPKYKDNAGFYVAPGGAPTSLDDTFNFVEANYNRNLSTNIDFKPGSILDDTQRLINSADGLQGEARLKHVGNAMNQVSKVFNDGYKEMTKGSQVLRYSDNATGAEAGIEYCRVFTKDTPYFTFGDLQKSDGITTAGRKFSYSVFDNTYNLNIAPLRGVDSTNIFNNKVKKYMFSIENLAWRTSDRPGYTYDELPACERGPNGGRIMWFPPYDITFSDDSKPDFGSTSFLGRPEPIYTYKNTSRSGSLKWKIIVDTPASLNTIIEKQLANTPKERLDSIVDSFFAGCTKYDLYELGIKFNTIPTRDLFTYQELLNNPRLTAEEFGQVVSEIQAENVVVNNGESGSAGQNTVGGQKESVTKNEEENPFKELDGLGFYFFHNAPGSVGSTTSDADFGTLFENYKMQFQETKNLEPQETIVEDGAQTTTYLKESVDTLWNSVITNNFDKLSKSLREKTNKILDAGGSVQFELQGSSSAPGSESDNLELSQRRISSVEKWIAQLKDSNQISYGELIKEGKIIIKGSPSGENTIIPIGETPFPQQINCNITPKQVIRPVSSIGQPSNLPPEIVNSQAAERFSVPAMACRRVILKATTIQFKEPVTTTNTENNTDENKVNETNQTNSNVTTNTKKPIPQVDVTQKIKEGISKKVLRQLFTECDYFQVIKETNPMVYDTFKEKIKYFSPAFHSTTPEGLNARLTFLNQCTRPGQTIPVIGPDGRPKYNDALNTAFGAPPILVLRVGDFYHSKIVPTGLQIAYDPLIFDMNPEGIGIQPMIATVTLSFNFIGGMGLKEPIDQLQNALSFNYYANTEIYDERATATEDTSARDKYVVENILASQQPVKPIENPPPKKGGDTIGTILTTVPINGTTFEEGEIEYTSLMTELSNQTNNYFKTVFNQLKTIQNTTNYGMLQLVGFNRKYSKGELCFFSDSNDRLTTNIYGKPEGVEGRIEKLKDRAIGDINNKENPIIFDFLKVPNIQAKSVRAVQEFLKTTLKIKQNELNQIVVGPINEMTNFQENYVQTFKKMDAVIYNAVSTGNIKGGVDGKTLETGENKIYEIIQIEGQPNFDKMFNQYKTISENINKYESFIEKNGISNKSLFFENSSTFQQLINDFGVRNLDTNRFYIMMCDTFVDDAKYNVFREQIKNIKEIRENPSDQTQLLKIVDNLQILYKKEFELEKKLFADVEVSPEYKAFDTFKLDTIETKFKYTTDYQDVVERQKIMRRVYSNNNDNVNDTFNLKVKFN